MKYTIGIDFGTLSGRALLVETASGREIAYAEKNYAHAIMDEYLSDGVTALPPDWALQDPADYLEVLHEVVPSVLKQSGVSPDDVIGVSIDFTACTVMPILSDGTPLCFLDEYKNEPHAYVKLWKHHAAQKYAEKINELAAVEDSVRLARYGGKISSEWLLPKAWQLLDEAPDVYARADRFIEAGDWIVMQLIGKERRSICAAGYKAMWHKTDGYPTEAFLSKLDLHLSRIADDKLSRDIYPLGTKVGIIDARGAALCGLKEGTAVGVSVIDAHAAVPAAGICETGTMLLVIGTSTCHILLDSKEHTVPGICGIVKDGIIGGFYGYEAGQSCVGDHFDWFIKNLVPEKYAVEAHKRGISLHELLREKASRQKPGESGLLALDWWNGNRSVLVDSNLSGLIMGMTLATKPEDLYRALIEATAYGTRVIIEAFESSGIKIDALIAAGGIANKDEMMMQIYADVTNREIRLCGSNYACALGSAIFAAVAAGKACGGYDSMADAVKYMSNVKNTVYHPIAANHSAYNQLYREYVKLHDYFGSGGNDVMKHLRAIRNSVADLYI